MTSIPNNDSYHPVFDQDSRRDTKKATIAATGQTSTAVDLSAYRSGMFYLPAEFNTDAITLHVSNKTDGTFTTLYNDGDAAGFTFSAPAGAAWHVIPELVFSAGAIKIHTSVAVAANAEILFCLKA